MPRGSVLLGFIFAISAPRWLPDLAPSLPFRASAFGDSRNLLEFHSRVLTRGHFCERTADKACRSCHLSRKVQQKPGGPRVRRGPWFGRAIVFESAASDGA